MALNLLLRSVIRLVCSILACLVTLTGCNNSEPVITSFADVHHARIGVMTGSTSEMIAKKRFPKAQIKSFDDIMDAVAALKSAQLDCVIAPSPAALQVIKKNQDLRTLPEPLQNEHISIALKKGNDRLLLELNRIIAGLKADGTMADLKRRWFKADLSPYEAKEIPLPQTGDILRVGVSATREPINFMDQNGNVTGHDGEFARIIGAKLKRPVEFSNMKFTMLLPALQSGKIDLIISGMTSTEERKKAVDFSEPYLIDAQVVLARKVDGAQTAATASSLKIASANDLHDKRLGVLMGTIYDAYATKTYPKATVLQYKSLPDIILALKTGKIDASFYVLESLSDLLRADTELAIVGEPLFTVPVGVSFNKSNSTLRQQFNSFLQQAKANGLLQDMVKRWITDGGARMPEITNTGANGRLTAGITSDKGLPFSALHNGKLAGFDIELLERFAAHLGKRLEYKDMEFGGLITATATGKVDLAASTLMINEERMKQVDFSDPYSHLTTSIVTLKKNTVAGATGSNPLRARFVSFFSGVSSSFYSNIIHENRYLLILDGLKTTVIISVFSTLFGTMLGALVCFMRMSNKTALNLPAKAYIAIMRGTPVLVILMLIFYVVFASVDISPALVAVIAFGMNFAAYVSEIFRSGIEGIDKGQTEAGIALGFTKVGAFLHIILPQTVRRILPVYKGEFISLVKMTSIVGYIAVQDLTKASDIIRSRTFDAFFPLIMVAILYFLISWTLMQSLEYLERKTDPKQRIREAGNR